MAADAVFDARFSILFGWDILRKCWVIQIREPQRNRMILKRDVDTTTAMTSLEYKRILAAVSREMESWLPF